ncbi:MAG: MBL fold metallo-hydrolase [Prevotella sp.]|nr:MBL fold metallo-hydrolase [Prevotella sp.]
MLNIQKFVFNPYQENTFIVSDETNECVIIDCGALFDNEQLALTEYIEENRLTPVQLLCTHGHFDHCVGIDMAYQQYGLKPLIHSKDAQLLEQLADQAMYFIGIEYDREVPPIGKLIDEKDVINFGNHRFTILHTPGHTPGSILFYCEEEHCVFSGDTLFQMSIGRTDFPGGSYQDMMNSLRLITTQLPEETIVWSGHGPKTTIGEEQKHNPFLRYM